MTTSFGSLCHRQDRRYAAIFLGGQGESFVSVNPLAGVQANDSAFGPFGSIDGGLLGLHDLAVPVTIDKDNGKWRSEDILWKAFTGLYGESYFDVAGLSKKLVGALEGLPSLPTDVSENLPGPPNVGDFARRGLLSAAKLTISRKAKSYRLRRTSLFGR